MPLLLKNFLDPYFAAPDDWRFFLLSNWPTVVGNLHTKMRLEKIQDDMLVIGVYNMHWMHELFMLSRSIIKTINAKLDQPYVTKVRFVIAEPREQQKAKKIMKTSIPERSYTLSQRERKVLDGVKDTELQEALKNFLVRCENTRR